MMARLLLVLAVALALGTAACGKKGSLEPPEGTPTDRPRPGR
jgi:predicted small lipoprotein YifL